MRKCDLVFFVLHFLHFSALFRAKNSKNDAVLRIKNRSLYERTIVKRNLARLWYLARRAEALFQGRGAGLCPYRPPAGRADPSSLLSKAVAGMSVDRALELVL